MIIIQVIKTMSKLVFNPRLVEAKILGIIIKIIKGFFAPPVK